MINKKLVLITGATSGMGLATAIELAKEDYNIVLLGRNEEKGKTAVNKVKLEGETDDVIFMQCDLASLESIRAFVTTFKNKYNKLDILINNAGVLALKRETTKDGFERQIGVNHLGHFLLTNLLLDLIKKSEDGRIINVSSGGHKAGDFYKNDPHFKNNYNLIKAYGQSKLANILFTKELDRKLNGTNVSVNALHPGGVQTSLGVNRETGFGETIYTLVSPFLKTPKQGASTAIYLATDDKVKDISGEYFINKKIATPSHKATSIELAKVLWEWSAEEVNLNS